MLDVYKESLVMEKEVYKGSADEVLKLFNTSLQGLTTEEASKRFQEYGANKLTEIKGTPMIYRFLGNFVHLFAILLWIGGILAFIGGTPELGYAIFAVIVINALFSFWQEFKAEKATEALKKMLPSYAKVVRDGEQAQIFAEELIPGDLVLLEEGDNISADCRVVQQFSMRVNNSILTGESEPVRRTADAFIEDVPITELPNMIFAGTSVSSGNGKAIVVTTAMNTQFGKIATMTQAVEEDKSPLQIQMEKVTRLVAFLALSLGVIFFIIGRYVVGFTLTESFLFSVGIIVANVPEGLLPTITLSLAMGVQRMAGRNAIVKKLSSVETLGSTTVICTDKTGTLTQNEMTVREIWIGGDNIKVTGAGYDPVGEFMMDDKPLPETHLDLLKQLSQTASFCNNSRLLPPSEESELWKILGDPTEAALLVAAKKSGFDYDEEMKKFARYGELPFDSKRKRMTTIHFTETGEMGHVKGAPKEVLDLCKNILTHKGIRPLTDEDRAAIMTQNDEYARMALRVLAMANRELGDDIDKGEPEEVEQELTFIGLMAMMDPPREEVEDAVVDCKRAGIRIIMITGDYGLTAESIARKINIVGKDVRIITGVELDTMDDKELGDALYSTDDVIFARVAPEHKMRVVTVLKDHDEVVAVTGDGVNDAPALKKADIGVAMGIAGTDVAKEASEMILTDDNFASIVHAIEEGRAVFDNIRKFVTYIFASNIPQIVPFIAMAIFGIPLPLTVIQILAVDLGTDILPALALGTELPEPDVMDRPPRSKNERLLNWRVLTRAYLFLGPIEAAAGMAGYFLMFFNNGYTMNDILALGSKGPAAWESNIIYIKATTMTFVGIVATQIGNGFAVRTEKSSVFKVFFRNKLYLGGIAFEVILTIILVYVSPFNEWIGFAPISFTDWLFLLAWAPIILLADETRKFIVRRYTAGKLGKAKE